MFETAAGENDILMMVYFSARSKFISAQYDSYLLPIQYDTYIYIKVWYCISIIIKYHCYYDILFNYLGN